MHSAGLQQHRQVVVEMAMEEARVVMVAAVEVVQVEVAWVVAVEDVAMAAVETNASHVLQLS